MGRFLYMIGIKILTLLINFPIEENLIIILQEIEIWRNLHFLQN